jgi:hypothetical protein
MILELYLMNRIHSDGDGGAGRQLLETGCGLFPFFRSKLNCSIVGLEMLLLQGHVNEESGTIFDESYEFDSLIGPAKQAIAFYEAQIKATKDAMRAWTLVGIKLNVVKDVRKLRGIKQSIKARKRSVCWRCMSILEIFFVKLNGNHTLLFLSFVTSFFFLRHFCKPKKQVKKKKKKKKKTIFFFFFFFFFSDKTFQPSLNYAIVPWWRWSWNAGLF